MVSSALVLARETPFQHDREGRRDASGEVASIVGFLVTIDFLPPTSTSEGDCYSTHDRAAGRLNEGISETGYSRQSPSSVRSW